MVEAVPPHGGGGRGVRSTVFLWAAVGNALGWEAGGVAGAGLEAKAGLKSRSDTVPPSLTRFALSPDAIDTSQEAATVTVEFTATDNLSGVKSVEVVLVSSSGYNRQHGSAVFVPAKEITGSVQLTFPQGSEPAVWKG